MALIQKLVGKVLIQIGDNAPVEIGTVEIPIELSIEPKKPAPVFRHDLALGRGRDPLMRRPNE
jgi:hypothetical protein